MAELSTLGAVIKPAYEGQTGTWQSGADRTKLDGIQAGAQVNPAIATTADAQAGIDTVKMMTAARVLEEITQFAGTGGGTSALTLTSGSTADTAYTHAVSTSILRLLSSEMVPATAFGIYPNSGADETTRIQNAMLDLANEGPTFFTGRKRALYFQNGTYLTSTGINATVSTLLAGDGGAVFQYNGAAGAGTYVIKVTIPGGGARVNYGMFRGIKIDGRNVALSAVAESGIWFATPSDWSTLLQNVQIVNCGLYGVRIAGATNLFVSDFRTDTIGRSAIMVEAEDTRQNMIAVHTGTSTWNTPANASLYTSYVGSGTVAGALAYWGAAVIEMRHTGSANGGDASVSLRDYAVEWALDGDPLGCGVILDRNASGNPAHQNFYLLENIHGFCDTTNATVGCPMVGFRGSASRQPTVIAHNARLNGANYKAARDFLTSTNYGTAYSSSFTWANPSGTANVGIYCENGKTMFGLAIARPAASNWLNGYSYFATDTGALSFHVSGSWVVLAGGTGGGHVLQDEGSSTNLPARSGLNFIGAGVTVTDDGGNNRTNVTIPGNATPIASQAEAEAGTNNVNMMTPLRTAQSAAPYDGSTFVPTSISLDKTKGSIHDAYTQVGNLTPALAATRVEGGCAIVTITFNASFSWNWTGGGSTFSDLNGNTLPTTLSGTHKCLFLWSSKAIRCEVAIAS